MRGAMPTGSLRATRARYAQMSPGPASGALLAAMRPVIGQLT